MIWFKLAVSYIILRIDCLFPLNNTSSHLFFKLIFNFFDNFLLLLVLHVFDMGFGSRLSLELNYLEIVLGWQNFYFGVEFPLVAWPYKYSRSLDVQTMDYCHYWFRISRQ